MKLKQRLRLVITLYWIQAPCKQTTTRHVFKTCLIFEASLLFKVQLLYDLMVLHVLLSTHADMQGVDISFTVCLFVILYIMDFSGEDKASGVKFCMVVHRRPGQGISHFGELCSLRSPKSDELACGKWS